MVAESEKKSRENVSNTKKNIRLNAIQTFCYIAAKFKMYKRELGWGNYYKLSLDVRIS